MNSHSGVDIEVVTGLVAEAMEQIADHGEVDLKALCADQPEAYDAVVKAVDIAQRLSTVNALRHGADLLRGSVLGRRYELVRRIGAGAMGTVYLANDASLQREVAVKILHGALIAEEQGVARFEREATALAAIQSHSIVGIYDRGFTEGDAPFLVMELIDGVSLAEVLEDAAHRGEEGPVLETQWIPKTYSLDPLPEHSYVRQVVRWMIQIGAGLQAAHEAKVIHRDIKPSNVMIRTTGDAVLLDFGIAALESADDLTRTGASIGTPRYMAPEALGTRTTWQPGLDVYGLSATLYHLLALRAPFEGTHSEVLTALVSREVPPLHSVRSGLPRDLVAVVEHGLERDPKRRYQNVDALVADLQAFLEHRPVTARPVTSLERFLRRAKRSRAVQGAVAATAVIVLGALGYFVKQGSDGRAQVRGYVAWQHVPASLCLVKPISRAIEDETLRASVMKKLNELVATPVDPVPAHMLRAAFAFDQGEYGAAARDMDWIASTTKTPIAMTLADRYRAVAADPSEGVALDLTEMPPVQSGMDQYLLGFSLLRMGQGAPAYAALSSPATANIRHARELHLAMDATPITRMKRESQTDKDNLFRAAAALLTRVEALEEEFHGPSAMTEHIRTLMLYSQGQFLAALMAARAGLALADETHPTFENAGLSALQIGDASMAREILAEASRRAPGNTSIWEHRVRAEVMAGQHATARKLLGEAPQPMTGYVARTNQLLTGLVDIDEALACFEQEQLKESLSLATRGLAALRTLPDDSGQALLSETNSLFAIGEAICAGDTSQIFDGIFAVLSEGALRASQLEDLSTFFPDDLSPTQTATMARWLASVAEELRRRSGSTGFAALVDPSTAGRSPEPEQ
ncbi:MAG: tRNA A-37 threonylcarbamoyl transferase component Bud32 [Planctomycetota bacterium]